MSCFVLYGCPVSKYSALYFIISKPLENKMSTILPATAVIKTDGLDLEVHCPPLDPNAFIEKNSQQFLINNVSLQVKAQCMRHECRSLDFRRIVLLIRFDASDNNCDDIVVSSPSSNILNKYFTTGIWCEVYSSQEWFSELNFSMQVKLVKSPRSGFESLHDDTELTDFELKGDDGSVRAHKVVLAAASPVLRRMVSGPWREAEGVVAIAGMSKATLQDFKNYIYLRRLPETGLEHLVLLGSLYMMPYLEEAASAKAVEDLTAEKACDLLDYATKNKVVRLQ